MTVLAIVQARMSSARFPGKVLAPFRGEPIVRHVLRAVAQVRGCERTMVATSTDRSDDPLAAYVNTLGTPALRGPLANVFARFRRCVERTPCEWILRVSADSPLLSPSVLQRVVDLAGTTPCDLVTTIFPRTFPRGQNAELIRVSTFLAIDPAGLSVEELEHVTPVYYRNPERFRIHNVESGTPELAASSLAVDTIDDLQRLERLSDSEIAGVSNRRAVELQ